MGFSELSNKDRDYIANLRKSLESKTKKDIGFNDPDGEDGLGVLDDIEEAEEVKNERSVSYNNRNMPVADIFNDEQPIFPIDGSEYDESMLGFSDFDDPVNPLPKQKKEKEEPSPSHTLNELIDSLMQVRKSTGNPIVTLSIDGMDVPLQSLEVSIDHRIVRFNGSLS